MNKLLYFSLSSLLLIIFSCSRSNEEELRNDSATNSVCNTANIKFSADIAPILQANCYSCHNTTNASGGVNTENYAGVKIIADNGTLVGTITHASGFSPMPQGKPKLADCDINKIKAWIAQGTQNN
jgi:hypothetical protein